MINPTPLWGVVQILGFCLLGFGGVPIAITLGLLGVGFLMLYRGDPYIVMVMVGSEAWTHLCSYTISMIPLFVLMGSLVAQAGLGADAFETVRRWLGRVRGSLAMVASLTGALFGTVTGSAAATVATIGSVAWPEMKKTGYCINLMM